MTIKIQFIIDSNPQNNFFLAIFITSILKSKCFIFPFFVNTHKSTRVTKFHVPILSEHKSCKTRNKNWTPTGKKTVFTIWNQ